MPHVELQKLFLVFPVPPSMNHRLMPIRGRLIKSPEDRSYFNLIQKECLIRKLIPTKFSVEISIHWYRARKAGDADGRWKTLFDAMQGFVYVNDAQVKKYSVEVLDTDKYNPRVEVWVDLYGRARA